MWEALADALDPNEPYHANKGIFRGALDEIQSKDESLTRSALDIAEKHPALQFRFTELIKGCAPDEWVISRLTRHLKDDKVPDTNFAHVAPTIFDFRDGTLVPMMGLAAQKRGGWSSVVFGLLMRTRMRRDMPLGHELAKLGLCAAARSIREWEDRGRDARAHFLLNLLLLVEECCKQDMPKEDRREILEALILRPQLVEHHSERFRKLVRALAVDMTHEILELLLSDTKGEKRTCDIAEAWHKEGDSPLNSATASGIISWSGTVEREARLVRVAQILWPFEEADPDGVLRLTSVAQELVSHAQSPEEVALSFVRSVTSSMPHHTDAVIAQHISLLRQLTKQLAPNARKATNASILALEESARRRRHRVDKEGEMYPKPFEP